MIKQKTTLIRAAILLLSVATPAIGEVARYAFDAGTVVVTEEESANFYNMEITVRDKAIVKNYTQRVGVGVNNAYKVEPQFLVIVPDRWVIVGTKMFGSCLDIHMHPINRLDATVMLAADPSFFSFALDNDRYYSLKVASAVVDKNDENTVFLSSVLSTFKGADISCTLILKIIGDRVKIIEQDVPRPEYGPAVIEFKQDPFNRAAPDTQKKQ